VHCIPESHSKKRALGATRNDRTQMESSVFDHLDTLGLGKHQSDDCSNSKTTMNEANQKMLVDAPFLLFVTFTSVTNQQARYCFCILGSACVKKVQIV
jgi:hypothetical protein